MDRAQLESKLIALQRACESDHKPITNLCVEPASSGDTSTSFIVKVKADWVDENDCYDALDYLFEKLFVTTDADTRKNIFAIQVLDSKDSLHCEGESQYFKPE